MAKSNDRPKMGDLIRQLPNVETPVQEVRPVADKAGAAQIKLQFFVPEPLATQIKVYAAQSGKSIKDISIDAYALYFNQLIK